jgi:cytochrome c
MQRKSLLAASILALLASLGALPLSVSAQGVQAATGPGATFFESRCVACHSLDANRVGPMLRGVVGRKVASVPGYEYSEALKRVSGRWDAQRLEMWLTDPQSVAPGTKMAFSLASATDRAAVIQYLDSTSVPSGAAKR